MCTTLTLTLCTCIIVLRLYKVYMIHVQYQRVYFVLENDDAINVKFNIPRFLYILFRMYMYKITGAHLNNVPRINLLL